MLKNWVLVLYGSSEAIDRDDPVSVPLNRSSSTALSTFSSSSAAAAAAGSAAAAAIGNVLRHQLSSSPSLIGSTPPSHAYPASSGPITPTTIITNAPLKPTKGGGKAKSQVGQGNGKSPARNKAQQTAGGGGGSGNRKGGKHDKNKESELNGGGGARKKQQPPVSSNTPVLSQQQYRKHGGNNQGSSSMKPTFRPKQPKKEVQVLNELQRKTTAADKTYKQTSEKTIKAPKQVKENANLMLRLQQQQQQLPPSPSSTNAPPTLSDGERQTGLTTSPSTASTASQTRLSKVLFQKYDRIQQVYPEFHPYVPPISEAEKKASLFLAMPNPNSKKQSAETGKAFRENGKIIFFSDSDFFPATTKPQLAPPQSPVMKKTMSSSSGGGKEQQRNGIEKRDNFVVKSV